MNELGETLSYNGVRQIGVVSFKWGSLFGAFSLDSKQQISFRSSSVVSDVLLLSHGCCSFNQYNLQDCIDLQSDPIAHMLLSYHFG